MKDNSQMRFQVKLEELGVSLNEMQLEQLQRYYEMLIERGKVMNLTTITDLNEVQEKHFIDSLAIIKIVEMKENLHIIDVGTGAGFPGIPIKIAFPQVNVVLLDSLNKRVRFLEEVIDDLGLSGIKAIHGRAEDVAKKPEYREKFDVSVSRAVANLSTLSEYCLPFVGVGGSFISYKSGDVYDEIETAQGAVNKLGGEIEEILIFQLPKTDIQRSLVKMKKIKATPLKYPRKAGLPGKEPLVE